ncbi:MAG: glycosyltransferase family 39 protein [Acidobacteria bacterium]|nr:glycosyltransferase family 39 protein [Acidobacteriota bacterium]MCA1641310.1 glycosyltransferase family 39 protein [Acidobacteriota bacterium]
MTPTTETTTARATAAPQRAPRAIASRAVAAEPLVGARRGAALFVAGCGLVAFALRLLVVLRVESVITPDGAYYAWLGYGCASGNFAGAMTPFTPPLYPWLVGLSSLFFSDIEFAGRFVSVVAGALLVAPAYALARDSYGERVARIAAVVVALHPLLVYYSSELLTESTYTLAFTCGVLAGWAALSRAAAVAREEAKPRAAWLSHFLAGVVFGACYLIKPEAAGYVLLLAAARAAVNFSGARRSFKRTAPDCLALAAGFFLLALPHLLYLRAALGGWTLSGKLHMHLWQGGGRAGEFASPSLVPDYVTAVVQAARGARNEFDFFNLVFPLPFVAVAALGLFRAGWTRERARRELYLAAFVAATLAGYAVTLPNIRFLVPLLPILVCWLARGVVELEGWLAETLANRRASVTGEVGGATGNILARGAGLAGGRFVSALVVAALLASLVPAFVFLMRGDRWGDYHGQKLAAVWIKEHSAQGSPRIMATAPVAAFYANGQHVALAAEDYDSFVVRARRERADFVVVNERSLRQTPLRPLLDERAEHPGLRLVHAIRETPGHAVLVYVLAQT